MNKIILKIPFLLIISRILFGIIIPLIASLHIPNNRLIIFWLIILGFLSDFLDGYLARLLDISNQKLRRIDTIVDRFFWISILCSIWILSSEYLSNKILWILLILGLEVINYAISFIRFKKEICTHAILSKFWAISLLLGFCDIILHGNSLFLFDIAIALGFLSRIDTGLIMLILPKWDYDIPSFYHAIKIRKGKDIRRLKIFNG